MPALHALRAGPYDRFRSGFTLFEIGISLLILGVAITAMGLSYPVAIKTQQMARFRLYAGAKVLEINDSFANDPHLYFNRPTEGELLGQCTFAGNAPADLDSMMCFSCLGLVPLPNQIALRLDSDNDEIAKIVQHGSRLFYSSPYAFETGYNMRNTSSVHLSDIPSETQSLIFAVVGDAQQNALANHPCLSWPYQDFYPNPAQPRENDTWTIWETEAKLPAGAKAKFDALYAEFNAMDRYGPSTNDPNQLKTWLGLAQELVVATVPASCLDMTGNSEGPVPLDPLALPAAGGWDLNDQRTFPKPWSVLALRYLANLAMVRTASGAPAMPEPQNTDARKYAEICHEAMVKWAMRYASADPYDWGASRPLNRNNAMDYPLLQFDLFPTSTDPAPFPIGDGTGDVTWMVVAPKQPQNFGQAYGLYGYIENNPKQWLGPNHAAIAGSWGDFSHFNLTKPFEAAERDRQIVCWAVDWRSYEDFEEAPSGPFDANCYNYDSTGKIVAFERALYPPDVYFYWRDASRTTLHEWIQHPATSRDFVPQDSRYTGDASETVAFKSRHLGIFGADRNGNGVFDRGPVPKSVRLRAISICRYNFYDKRFISSLRF